MELGRAIRPERESLDRSGTDEHSQKTPGMRCISGNLDFSRFFSLEWFCLGVQFSGHVVEAVSIVLVGVEKPGFLT